VDEHAHVDCSPTQLARSVVPGAAQGLWSRCYRMPANMCVPATVAGPPVPGTPKVSIFEARKHVAREPSERIGDLSGVVSVREGVL
jgi:hypothetical protein